MKYQIHDNVRSKWLIGLFVFFVIFTYWLISFTAEPSKVLMSVLNVVIIFIPLFSIIIGTIYTYNNKNYIIFMLTQPINRKTLFFGLILGLVFPFILSFVLGIGIPILLNYQLFMATLDIVVLLMLTGTFLITIFIALASLISTFYDDKLKGLGISIFVWLFFTVIYDGLILYILQAFQDYPLEKLALILTLINPIDLGRILTVLKFDVSALMGYTGAVFEKFFGSGLGITISLVMLGIWSYLPIKLALRVFNKKDL
ncbi:MAG: ABC transporter permease subunit [Ignavibacteriales bacterium]|nr:ABC transporter permease subunit [Ignavibacteriales bacterium]